MEAFYQSAGSEAPNTITEAASSKRKQSNLEESEEDDEDNTIDGKSQLSSQGDSSGYQIKDYEVSHTRSKNNSPGAGGSPRRHNMVDSLPEKNEDSEEDRFDFGGKGEVQYYTREELYDIGR